MKNLPILLISVFLIIWQPFVAQSQTSSSTYFEPGYQLTPLPGGAGSFIEIEAGKQLSGGFSFGAVVHFLVSDINRTSGNLNESMNSLWYAGPRLQYSSELNTSFSFYGGTTFGLGTTDYQETEFDLSTKGGFLVGVRPEAGIRYQAADILKINLGANIFYGHINRSNITGAPALRVGFRLGK